MVRYSNISLRYLGSGSSILVSETHHVLHEARLITLLPETIHTDLSPDLRVALLTGLYRRILSLGADNELRIYYFIPISYLYADPNVFRHLSDLSLRTLMSQRDVRRFNRVVTRKKVFTTTPSLLASDINNERDLVNLLVQKLHLHIIKSSKMANWIKWWNWLMIAQCPDVS